MILRLKYITIQQTVQVAPASQILLSSPIYRTTRPTELRGLRFAALKALEAEPSLCVLSCQPGRGSL